MLTICDKNSQGFHFQKTVGFQFKNFKKVVNIVGLLSFGLRKSRWLQLFNRKFVNYSQMRSYTFWIIRKDKLPILPN